MTVAMSVIALTACNGSPPTHSEPLEGAGLVAGTSIPRHGLLVVPRGGGVAELRAVEDPSRVRWSGTAELPPTQGAHPLGRAVVLHATDGIVLVFHPSGEVLREVGSVPAHARWVRGEEGGAFVWDTNALVITEDGDRLISAADRVSWAAPASGDRALVLTETGDAARLELWDADGDVPVAAHSVPNHGPALVTGWGREVLLAEGDDGRTLVGRTLPDLDAVEHTRLDRAPVVLAASPSQHRLFAASAGESRLEAIDRYGWETVGRSTVDGTIREVRPAVTGELVLAFDGAQIWALRAGDTRAAQIGSDWRIDLPLGLPGGRILGAIGGSVRSFDREGGDPIEVVGPADAWWLPVRWTPRRVEPVVSTPTMETSSQDSVEVDESGGQVLNIGLTTVGRVAGRAVADMSSADIDFVTEASVATPGEGDPYTVIPDGFYAVATSSRQLESLRALQSSLEGSGYRTEVLTRRDEANELWYRLMVGPYSSRQEAETAVGSLRRERGISAWIHEALGGGR